MSIMGMREWFRKNRASMLVVFVLPRRQAILTKTEKVGALPQHLTRQIRRQINLTSRQVKNSPAGLAKEMAVWR